MQDLERFLFNYEKQFLSKFCYGACDLTKISFSSKKAFFTYVLSSGQHISDSTEIINIINWMKELEGIKND